MLRTLFRRRLDRYEMRDVMDVDPPRDVIGIPALSGAFMLAKRVAIDRTGGFDPKYFLYFEDFDWSVRLNRVTKTAYVPSVQIGHHGGGAAKQGAEAHLLFREERAALLPPARLEVVLNPVRSPGPATVVVTGADGFAGRAACAHFRAAGIPLRGLVRALSPATAARPDMLPVGDLATISDGALANALRGAHAVVHLAGRAHAMRDDAADPLSAFRAVNVAATERLARAAAAAGVAHFVFASSVKVNGESTPPERPFRESDPPDPRDDYAVSKWEAECALGDVARETGHARHRAAAAVDVRTSVQRPMSRA